jgi:hypothetical protein
MAVPMGKTTTHKPSCKSFGKVCHSRTKLNMRCISFLPRKTITMRIVTNTIRIIPGINIRRIAVSNASVLNNAPLQAHTPAKPAATSAKANALRKLFLSDSTGFKPFRPRRVRPARLVHRLPLIKPRRRKKHTPGSRLRPVSLISQFMLETS